MIAIEHWSPWQTTHKVQVFLSLCNLAPRYRDKLFSRFQATWAPCESANTCTYPAARSGKGRGKFLALPYQLVSSQILTADQQRGGSLFWAGYRAER